MIIFFNDTATTEIYTLSLHDALPIYLRGQQDGCSDRGDGVWNNLGDVYPRRGG